METNSSQKDLNFLYNLLQDQTRFEIFLYLHVYQPLTLKELAEYLNKSKTTIFHHIRKLEEFLEVVEKEEGRRLKTKYFQINWEKLKPKDPVSMLEFSKIENLLLSNIMEKFLKGRESLSLDESIIKTFMITEDTRHIFEEFEVKLLEASKQNEYKKNDKPHRVRHFFAYISVPLEEVLKKT
ncbi:MAG: helix-turn-helix domain-containing protein [Candidatus Hodarchaeota archaeon]